MSRRRAARLAFAGGFVLLFAYVLGEAYFGFGQAFPRARLFPLAIGIPSFLLALLVLALEVRAPDAPEPRPAVAEPALGPPLDAATERRRTLAMMGWVVGFFLGIWLLGFTLAVPVLTFLYLKFGAGERWVPTLILTGVSFAFFYGVFDYTLHLPFPPGVLLEGLL
jgi:hypothetical protein